MGRRGNAMVDGSALEADHSRRPANLRCGSENHWVNPPRGEVYPIILRARTAPVKGKIKILNRLGLLDLRRSGHREPDVRSGHESDGLVDLARDFGELQIIQRCAPVDPAVDPLLWDHRLLREPARGEAVDGEPRSDGVYAGCLHGRDSIGEVQGRSTLSRGVRANRPPLPKSRGWGRGIQRHSRCSRVPVPTPPPPRSYEQPHRRVGIHQHHPLPTSPHSAAPNLGTRSSHGRSSASHRTPSPCTANSSCSRSNGDGASLWL